MMKINWGTAIVLAFIGFISFILFFVIRMSTDHRAHHDLVTEDYYRAELSFQQEIDRQNNAIENAANVTVLKNSKGLVIQFPANMEPSKIKGRIFLYRPSNKKLDFSADLELVGTQMLIRKEHLLEGRWDINVSWEYENNSYLYKEKLTY